MADKTTARLEVSPAQAAERYGPEQPLFDIRSDASRMAGAPPDSIPATAETVRQALACERGEAAHPAAFILCDRGVTSLKVVNELRAAGIDEVFSVAGGFRAWSRADLPVDYPEGMDAARAERYARHLVMPQVGPRGQNRLLEARVLMVGLGGLNSPAALYLAAAGVGTLGLADDDTVERSNLQRQVIHSEDAIGRKKALSAQEQIRKLNPDIDTVIYDAHVDDANVAAIVEPWDVVIDGTDSFPARYVLNEACVAQGKPLVYGAVMRFQGQVSVFWPAADRPAAEAGLPCYRCLFPEAPDPADAPSCAEAGVLGILPGIVGTLQATEALKLVLGIGSPLIGRLLLFDALNMDFRETRLRANPACTICGPPKSARP